MKKNQGKYPYKTSSIHYIKNRKFQKGTLLSLLLNTFLILLKIIPKI